MLTRFLRRFASVLFVGFCAHAQALDLQLGNANSNTGDGGYLSDYQWASDPVLGDYWQSITIIGTDRSAWMARDTPWGSFIANTTTLSTTFAQAASVSFDWLYTSYDTNLSADSGGYTLNGVSYALSSIDSAAASGHVSLALAVGDSLAWYVSSSDMLGGRATLAMRNVQISVVPEPAPAGMLLAGLLVVGAIARRRLAARNS